MGMSFTHKAAVVIGGLIFAGLAHAESNVAVGAGKLSASARVNIKIVIPEVLAVNPQRQVVTEKTGPLVRTFTIELNSGEHASSADTDGFMLANFNGAKLFQPKELVPTVTVSKP